MPTSIRNFCITGVVTTALLAATTASAQNTDGERVEYRGRTLIGSTYHKADNAEFFRIAKHGIDMAESLPGASWNQTAAVKVIRYVPPSPHRAKIGVLKHLVGAFHHDRGDAGELAIYRTATYSSPLEVALALTNSGIYIRERQERSLARNATSAQQRRHSVECRADRASLNALRILHPVQGSIGRRNALLRERGCFNLNRPGILPRQRTASR